MSDSSLLHTKFARMQVDYNAKLLGNRIAILQAEQLKLLKKIDGTRKRADEIQKARDQNDEKMQKVKPA